MWLEPFHLILVRFSWSQHFFLASSNFVGGIWGLSIHIDSMNMMLRIVDSRGQEVVVVQDVVKLAHWSALSRGYSANFLMLMSPSVRSHIKRNIIFVGLNSGLSNDSKNTKVRHEFPSTQPICVSLYHIITGKGKLLHFPCFVPLGGSL